MHVYHYNHTERSALERLAADHGVGEVALTDTGRDRVLRRPLPGGPQRRSGRDRVLRAEGHGTPSPATSGATRSTRDRRPSSNTSSTWPTHDPANLDRIAAYNEDDVRSTLALRDWLVGLRPETLAWRAAVSSPRRNPELDAQVAALHAYGPDTPEHLLGDLLGYWVRERRANMAPKLARTCRHAGSSTTPR